MNGRLVISVASKGHLGRSIQRYLYLLTRSQIYGQNAKGVRRSMSGITYERPLNPVGIALTVVGLAVIDVHHAFRVDVRLSNGGGDGSVDLSGRRGNGSIHQPVGVTSQGCNGLV